MVKYTDDKGEMDGANGRIIKDFLPHAETMAKWPVFIYDTRKDGTEELVEFRDSGNVEAVVMTQAGEVELRFGDGRKISAHLAKNFRLENHNKQGG